MSQTHVLEIVTSRILPDFPPGAYAAAAAAVEPWLAGRPGFVSRRFGEAEDGSFIDCREWASIEDALAAENAFAEASAAAPMNAIVDPLSVTVRRYYLAET